MIKKTISFWNHLDFLVRNGQPALAKVQAMPLLNQNLSADDRIRLAAIFRRLSLSRFGVKVLYPLVKPSQKTPRARQPEALIEYAANLVRLELNSEALGLLDAIDRDRFPSSDLFRAFAHMSQWNYLESEAALLRYKGSLNPLSYEDRVAEVNLAVGRIFLGSHRTETLGTLQRLKAQTLERGEWLLYGNVLELLSQLETEVGNFNRARDYVREGLERLGRNDGIDSVYLQKQGVLVDLHEFGCTPRILRSCVDLQDLAQGLGFFEVVRDLDFHLAVVSRQDRRIAKLWFGTPHESFRRRLLERVRRREDDLPLTYSFLLTPKSRDSRKSVARRSPVDPLSLVKPGQAMHRLLRALTADFYKSPTFYQIFSLVFPGEVFNPVSSPDKVHQLLMRVRAVLRKSKTGMSIVKDGDRYYLRSSGRVEIKVGRDPATPMNHWRVLAAQKCLSDEFGGNWFTAAEAAETLRKTLRTLQRWVNELKAAGIVEVQGLGRSTKYRLTHMKA